MKKLLFVFTLFIATQLFAQSYPFQIKGKIISEKEKTPIEAATIHLERIKDSSVVSYTISDEKGEFLLEGKSFHKNLKLFVSYIGMDNYSKKITLPSSLIDLKNINLKEDSNILKEVVIKSRAPITVKKDTLEFNVKSFKTKKNANVEDLLKKLPGVEVDAEGKITVNGKAVNKILVNGKPFFGNDPTITTKNLSKEIIEKVQITDTKTKSESFTGEKGYANNKTINLTIKKENNKGWFGRVSAGAGTEKRFEGATMINRFDNDQRVSVLASTNNINSPGFSFGEIQKMFGGGGSIWINGNGGFSVNGRRFGGGQGIIKSKTLGATYADTYKKNVDVNLNYFHSGSSSENDATNNRENILPDNKRYFSNTISNSIDNNDNHAIDAEIDIEIDSTFLINIKPSFIYNKREGSYTRNEESLDNDNVLTNRSTSSVNNSSEANNFKNDLEITKKINTKGSFIKASITNQIDKSTSNEYALLKRETFKNPSEENLNQFSDAESKLNTLRTSISYRYPIISKKFFVDFNYEYRRNERENIENTLDFNTTTNQYDIFNTDFSSNFTYNDIAKTPSIEFTYKAKKWRFNFETGYANRTLENNDKLRPQLNLSRDFNNLNLGTGFRYTFESKASIYFDYSLENTVPNLIQIQPFTNATNPLNIITGNPNLKPTERHRGYLNFHKYDWQKGTGLWFYVSADLNNNHIVSKSTINNDFVRTTTFENVDGAYNVWAGGSYSKKIKLDSITNIRLKLGGRLTSNKNINFFNDIKYNAVTTGVTPEIGVRLDWNKIVRIDTEYRVRFSRTAFDIDNFTNQNFARHTFDIRTRTNVPKKLEWRNNIKYTYNPDVIGFNKSAWFWNSTLAYSILNDKASITLKAYDLLNQNNNVRRTATENYIEDSQNTVLQQYFMLGFSWKFNSLGKKGKIREYDFH